MREELKEPFMRKWRRRIKGWSWEAKQRIRPTWLERPSNIQIDTHNYCNLRCAYCNVKPGGGWNLPRGHMPMSMIKYIMDYWGHLGVESFALYINGEPLMDTRLREMCEYAQKNTNAYCIVDTNGTMWENRYLLIHPNLKAVRFTISANTPETYEKVHGRPYYDRAIKTFKWFLLHRLPTQKPLLHFIVCEHNMHELGDYIKRWIGIHMRIFPLHRVPNIQLESDRMTMVEHWWDDPKQPNRPLDIWPNRKMEVEYFKPWETCQGTWSFSIAWDGRLLHCTDIPYKYNYGHIYERDMLEVWHERNRAKRTHEACLRCNVKHPKWLEIMDRYDI